MEQVRAMWLNGQIAATDQLMEKGRSQWYSASTVMAVANAQESVPEKKKGVGCLGSIFAAVFALVIFLIVANMSEKRSSGGSDTSALSSTIRGSSSIKRWLETNVADPDARIVALSEVAQVGEFEWKKARIAGRNALGGPIMNDQIFSVSGATVGQAWTVEQFAAWVDTEAAKLDTDAARKFRMQAALFRASTLYAQ